MTRGFLTSRRKIVLFVIGFALVVGGVVWWQLKRGSREPEYGGRPLSYWVSNGMEPITNGSRSMGYRLNAESTAAVKAIGPKAFPKLREWMTAPELGWRTKAIAWAQQFPAPFAPREIVYSLTGYDRYQPFYSAITLQALGRDAEGAIPFLTEMLEQHENRYGAVLGLCVIQPEGINHLFEKFPTIKEGDDRASILAYLQNSITREIEPACARFVAKWSAEDSNLNVRLTSAYVLGTFTNSAAVVVPALAKALTDRESAVRLTACQNLVPFGIAAASATVALRTALKDSNPQVRADAARALQAIGAPAVE